MKNKKISDCFDSLRKSPRQKKVKTEYKSNISFWDNISETKPEENKDSQAFSVDFSFTSAELGPVQPCSKISSVKFIIRSIEKQANSVVLYGDDVVCTVGGEWADLEYEINTKITVMSCLCCSNELHKEFIDEKIYITVDDSSNYLFVEDDLMTITNLCSSIRCINRPLVNNKVADLNFNFSDKCLVNGIVLHSVMEDVLIHNNYSLPYIMQATKKAIENNVMSLYVCNTTEKMVKSDILPSLKSIAQFQKNNFDFTESEKRIVSLTCNLKGNIDIVGEDLILEIKSGKYMDISHKAQVILYSLMMKEKYKRDFCAYLYYISSNNLVKIDIKHSEVKSLLISRNKLTLKNDIVDCDCCALEACKIITKILNLPEDHFLKVMWDSIEREENYRLKETWNRVIFKKQSDTSVVFKFDFEQSIIDDIYINIYNEDLIKLCKGMITSVEDSFMMVSLSEKINLEKNSSYFISFGCNDLFFKYLRYSLINIAYLRYLEKDRSGGFSLPGEELGLVERIEDDIECSLEDDCVMESPSEIDPFEEEIIMKSIDVPFQKVNDSNNIDSNTIDSKSSSFMYFTPPPAPKTKFRYQIPEAYKDQFLKLNEDQRNSLFMALNCENYKIIHGMPGTGKSSVIILLIKIMISLNLKVLLVCYTNLAITNILDKLKTVRSYRARKEQTVFKTSDDVRNYYKNVDLVASTCFGFSDAIFIDRKFDFCIIDEGSQQHLLLTLIPVSLSNKFVIFGDHLQLKPLVKSCKALSMSLFEYLLDEEHSELRIQYRMGKNIMRLSNILFYNNRLMAWNEIEDKVTFIDSSTLDYSEFIGNVRNSTILCYFNSQVKLTKRYTKCQVETIDRFQGSEDENIIVVFDPVSVCEVMESSERLNVALTRAKKSLTLVGDRNKMQEIDVLKRLLEIIKN
ncbi:DNA replication ATP-dependent helicase/nuclease DNA2 [Nosema granulosis]|uniref:DNA replication ATP-dependent helicase/nuclease DNA2 n=1 Tax=Nosema granulosis TaxID=83296 RepID=A0A9P6KZQ7_9MICR|nr:DNA replication ATP-dependent helicase/nuclease DNA2 [Nosema granulosis]